jgi:hypothetical protein
METVEFEIKKGSPRAKFSRLNVGRYPGSAGRGCLATCHEDTGSRQFASGMVPTRLPLAGPASLGEPLAIYPPLLTEVGQAFNRFYGITQGIGESAMPPRVGSQTGLSVAREIPGQRFPGVRSWRQLRGKEYPGSRPSYPNRVVASRSARPPQ